MAVLVVYGSKRGGTGGLAEMVADGLRGEGLAVDVAAADEVRSLAGYDTVIVGGALYAQRWHRAAARFVKRNTGELRRRRVYLFSSGPLDDSATRVAIPPVKGVARLMKRVDVAEHVTFGGRLAPDARGFPAASMARSKAGDWRDPKHVMEWSHHVATELKAPSQA